MTPPTLPDAASVRSIGCLMLNGIGDILCVTPTLHALRVRYPGARLTLMIRPHLSGLVAGNPDVDALLFYPRGLLRKLGFMAEARARRFDLWVDLHVPTFNTVSSNERDFLRNALLMRAAAPRFRLAYASPQLLPHLTHPVPVPDRAALTRTNIVDTTLGLVAPARPEGCGKHIPVSEADRVWARAALPARNARPIALFFGSRQPADLWPDARIVEFVALLAQALPDTEFVLVGGEHEAGVLPLLARSLEAPVLARLRNFIGKASMSRTGALLERCRLLVCTDSGPMHIADALGLPMVALFSSKNYIDIWRPLERRTVVLNHAVECGPCFRAQCPFGNRCMDLIEPREALAAVQDVLQRTERGAGGSPEG